MKRHVIRGTETIRQRLSAKGLAQETKQRREGKNV